MRVNNRGKKLKSCWPTLLKIAISCGDSAKKNAPSSAARESPNISLLTTKTRTTVTRDTISARQKINIIAPYEKQPQIKNAKA